MGQGAIFCCHIIKAPLTLSLGSMSESSILYDFDLFSAAAVQVASEKKDQRTESLHFVDGLQNHRL